MTPGAVWATPPSGARKPGAWASWALAASSLFFLVAAAPGTAQEAATEPETHPTAALVVLAYHPYPDDADPLGVPYVTQGDRSWDYFRVTYAHLDQEQDGFDFPSLVVDGTELVEGVEGFLKNREVPRWQERSAVAPS